MKRKQTFVRLLWNFWGKSTILLLIQRIIRGKVE